jgi:hypothetical protein
MLAARNSAVRASASGLGWRGILESGRAGLEAVDVIARSVNGWG